MITYTGSKSQLIAVAAHDTSTMVTIRDLNLPMVEFFKVTEEWIDRVIEAKPVYQDRHAMREVFMHWMLDHGELVKNFCIPFDEWKHEMVYQLWWHVAFYTRSPEEETKKTAAIFGEMVEQDLTERVRSGTYSGPQTPGVGGMVAVIESCREQSGLGDAFFPPIKN